MDVEKSAAMPAWAARRWNHELPRARDSRTGRSIWRCSGRIMAPCPRGARLRETATPLGGPAHSVQPHQSCREIAFITSGQTVLEALEMRGRRGTSEAGASEEGLGRKWRRDELPWLDKL